MIWRSRRLWKIVATLVLTASVIGTLYIPAYRRAEMLEYISNHNGGASPHLSSSRSWWALLGRLFGHEDRYYQPIWQVIVSPDACHRIDLAPLFEITEIESLHLPCVKLDDHLLKKLWNFTELRELFLYSDAITSDGFEGIEKLSQLKLIKIRAASLDDRVCLRLASVQFDHLYIGCSQITDEGLRKLGVLRGKSSVALSSTKITVSGIRYFCSANPLTSIGVHRDVVTDAELAKLNAEFSGRIGLLWKEWDGVDSVGDVD